MDGVVSSARLRRFVMLRWFSFRVCSPGAYVMVFCNQIPALWPRLNRAEGGKGVMRESYIFSLHRFSPVIGKRSGGRGGKGGGVSAFPAAGGSSGQTSLRLWRTLQLSAAWLCDELLRAPGGAKLRRDNKSKSQWL